MYTNKIINTQRISAIQGIYFKNYPLIYSFIHLKLIIHILATLRSKPIDSVEVPLGKWYIKLTVFIIKQIYYLFYIGI